MAMLAAIGATLVALVVAGLACSGCSSPRRAFEFLAVPAPVCGPTAIIAVLDLADRQPDPCRSPPRRTERLMTATAIKDPRRYFEAVDTRKRQATSPPVCVYLEVTNRCNLLCETCPRTFETLEPPADMTWELFTSIVDQLPDVARVVLHGVGEPMLVKTLPRMIRHLKDRGVYVLFNTTARCCRRRNIRR
jgi:hypothetical protein